MPNPAVAGSCTVGSFDCKNPAVLNATQPLQDLQPPVINLPSLLLQLPCGAKVPAQQVGVWVVMNGLTDASSTTAWARCWTGTHVLQANNVMLCCLLITWPGRVRTAAPAMQGCVTPVSTAPPTANGCL